MTRDAHDTRDTMATVRSISEKKIQANRRNARHSTGPKTEAGKHASRMNAVTHGLLAKALVITAGGYHEDAQAFAQLLEGLCEEFTPVGVAEDLEVQTIARCYWRKMRASRYEHGAIRMQTADVWEREKQRRETHFQCALRDGSNLEDGSRGIQYLLSVLQGARQELLNGTLAGKCHEWLKKRFPDAFPPPDETQVVQEGERRVGTADYIQQRRDKIDAHLRRLAALRATVAASEALNLETETHAVMLPDPPIVDKLIRYETSNDRELDGALHRLEAMQTRRRKQRRAPREET
jgi:hypothetical protein